MAKPASMKDVQLTTAQRKRLVALAKKNNIVWKEIVRKRRHSIAHALAGSAAFRAAAKKAKIIT